MQLPTVSVATEDERERVLSTVLVGFVADPMVRWFAPEAHTYLSLLPGFDAFCGGAVDSGTAYRTDNFEGAALWHPPGRGPDGERLAAFFQQVVPEEDLDDVFSVFGAMEEYHPEGECWYLPVIGVDPTHQGMGMGAALMKHALQIIDEAGQPAYLESSNPRNISLYERHGFEAMGEIQFGRSPVITPMLRQPQAA